MPKTLPAPPFEIPLTQGELALMGSIAVLWGQIDEGLNSVLRSMLATPPDVFDSLLGTQMIGSRVSHLRVAANHASRPKVRQLAIDLVERMTEVLPDRNAAMHGCWGWFPSDPSFRNLRSGIYNHQKPKVRFYAKQLPSLYERMTHIMTIIANLTMLAIEEDPEPTSYERNKIYFSPQPPDERAEGLWFRRGDRIIRVESKARGWKQG